MINLVKLAERCVPTLGWGELHNGVADQSKVAGQATFAVADHPVLIPRELFHNDGWKD